MSMQHLYSFTKNLEPQKQQAKRNLDCAGVVVATLATCQSLARQERHAELAVCRLQVSGEAPFTLNNRDSLPQDDKS